jgi:hypothetical protein
MNTNSFLNLTVAQLKKAAALKEKIEALHSELSAILGGEASDSNVASATERGRPAGKGGMSAAGKKRIAEAQKARWAKINAAKAKASPSKDSKVEAPAKKKRTMSPEAKAKIAEAQKARWAKVRSDQKP